MAELDLVYLEIIAPENFVSNFKTVKEFEEWLDRGSKQDLEHTLKAYSEADMFEHCSLINNLLTKKFK